MAADWLALGYNIPPEPSKNRVYVWRKLKSYGARYFKQGVAVLPLNRENLERFQALRGKIHAMGGEATLVTMQFLYAAEELALMQQFGMASDKEAAAVRESSGAAAITEELRQGLSTLFTTAKGTLQDFSEQLRSATEPDEK